MKLIQTPALWVILLALSPLGALAPKPSDIFMRSLSVRVKSEKETWDTRQAVRDFSVTRLEWVYFANREGDRRLIADLSGAVNTFGGTVNPVLAPLPGTAPFCQTLDGSPATVPWLRVYKNDRTNMCVNRPGAMGALSNALSDQIKLGVGAFQVDDVAMNVDVLRAAGGCFCEECAAGFEKYLGAVGRLGSYQKNGWGDGQSFHIKKYLVSKGAASGDGTFNDPTFPAGMKKDYEAFQMESVRAFLTRVKNMAALLAGKEIPFSKNTQEAWLDGVLDYTMYELGWGNASPEFIEGFIGKRVAQGSTVVFDGPKKFPLEATDLPVIRASFATAYGAGGYVFVPWDMFTAPAKPRYFVGAPDFGDLTAFIRKNERLFDDFPTVARPDSAKPFSAGAAAAPGEKGKVALFTHLPPGGKGTEAVVHLIRWGGGAGAVRVQLHGESLFKNPSGRVRVTVYEPGVAPRVLLEGDVKPLEVPLTLWALLRVEDLGGAPGLAAPAVYPFGGRVLGTQTLAVKGVGQSSFVFTRDGLEPNERSSLVPSPWVITLSGGESQTIKVRGLSSGRLSPVTEVTFTGERVTKATEVGGELRPGCTYEFYTGDFRSIPKWEDLSPSLKGNVEFFHQGPRPISVSAWAGRYRAYLAVPTTGRYRFYGFFMAQKGDLRVTLDGEKVFQVATSGGQGQGEAVLEKGLHPIAVEVAQTHPDGGKGGHYFYVGFSGPGVTDTRITDAHLVVEK